MIFFTGVAQGQSTDSASIQQERAFTLEESLDLGPKDPSAVPATREYASGRIERRKFDQKKWKEIIDSRNYTDTRTKKNSKEQSANGGASGEHSGNRAMQSDEEDQSRYDYESEGSSIALPWLGPLGQLIFYGAIIAIIAVILIQIARNTSFKLNPKRVATATNSADDIHDITELDTEGLIERAHKANDYKLAIRLYFLDLLKKLNEHGVIVWTKDKTNRDYLSELFSKQYYFDEVRLLTLAYERIWYGEHNPTEESYHQLRTEFQAINQKVKAL